jgi:CrcB protein
MLNVLLVGLGGFVGSAARYALGGGVQHIFPRASFPYGTLAVNVIGCLLIGMLSALAEMRGVLHTELRLFLLIGVLGGFTTFSTFAYETLSLFRNGDGIRASGNVLLNVAGCLVAVWIGDAIVRSMSGAGA